MKLRHVSSVSPHAVEGMVEHIEKKCKNDRNNNSSGNSGHNNCNNSNNSSSSSSSSRRSTHVQAAPDGGWGWLVVTGVCMVHIILAGFERSNGIIFLQLRDRFDKSATETSWVFSIFSSFRLLFAPVATMLCERYTCRSVVLLGSVLCTTGIIVSGFVTQMHLLYFTYGVLGGFGRALVYAPSLVIVGKYFDKRRGIAVGVATAGVGVGTIAIPPLTEYLFQSYGYLGTFLLLGGFISHYFICGALFRPLKLHYKLHPTNRNTSTDDIEAERGVHNDAFDDETANNNTEIHEEWTTESENNNNTTPDRTDNDYIKTDYSSEQKIPRILTNIHDIDRTVVSNKRNNCNSRCKLLDISLLKNRTFLTFCIQVCLFSLSFETAFVFLPALAKERGILPLESAYVVSILGVCDGVARIGLSAILDIATVKRHRLVIYNVFMFIVGFVAILIPSLKTFWHFAVVGAFYGVLTGVLISQLSVVIVDILGVQKLAGAIGIIFMFQGVSSLTGPIIGGLLKDALGGFDMAFYFGAAGIFAGAVVMVIGNVLHHRDARRQYVIETGT